MTHNWIQLSAATQISGQWTIPAGYTIDLTPGTYWRTGDLTVQSTGVLKCSACDNVTGTGATVILTTQSQQVGTVSMAANAKVALNAPSTGQFSGLVLAQDANGLPKGTTYSSGSSAITGVQGEALNSLVYFPNPSMTFLGNPSATGPRCLLLVVKSLTANGKSRLDSGGCVSTGSAIFRRSIPWRWPSEVVMRCSLAGRGVRLRCGAGSPRCAGSVAAEFALVAPILVLVAAGIADFGMLATRSAMPSAMTGCP